MTKDTKPSNLQAIVLADSFDPTTSVFPKPWGLLPVANRPLLDYTLEFVSTSKFTNVLLVSCQQTDDIRALASAWKGAFSSLTVVASEGSKSLGDVMRDLDSRALITTDFLLVPAGCISSDTLDQPLAQYKARVSKDPSCVMTVVGCKVSNTHALHTQHSPMNPLLALQKDDCRILHYECPTSKSNNKKFVVDESLFKLETDIRNDVLDTQLSICSPKIPPLFSDNFDFQTRQHLIKEVLTNEEILGQKMYMHILDEYSYAVCAIDWDSYSVISQQIVERWADPLVPEKRTPACKDVYSCNRNNIYIPINGKGQYNNVDESAKLIRNVMVGPKCKIGADVTLRNVVMGESCVIEDGVHLSDCILHSNVHISSAVKANKAIFMSESKVANDVTIEERCIVGQSIFVTESIVAGNAVVKMDEDNSDPSIILSPMPSRSTNKNTADVRVAKLRGDIDLWVDRNFVPVEIPVEEENVKAEKDSAQNVAASLPSNAPDSFMGIDLSTGAKMFYGELYESLLHTMDNKSGCDGLILEINASKLGNDVTVEELQQLVIVAILKVVHATANSNDLLALMKQTLTNLESLLKNYYKTEDARNNILLAVEEVIMCSDSVLNITQQIVHHIYNMDILDEESILQWADDLEDEERHVIMPKIQQFITWLQEAEEDSD